ncbi:MAG: D-tyrosyl-tRNA(Tyr) deacylase [Eggerthellaceae bacterium]|nr:D-tyrosyl-tRNA(Tyr) deacylase [Eggerthellaceae bacterium]
MRAVIQRVSHARVSIDGQEHGCIGLGFVILLGVGHGDTEDDARKLWGKISKMRIFEDESGKTNLPLANVAGSVMVVSQFTLYADCKKGNRPSFAGAMPPAEAKRLYEFFLELARADVEDVACGMFGAMMDIDLVNNGPFTIVLDTNEL